MNSQQGWWCYASEQAHCLLQCLNCLGSFIFAKHSRCVNFSFYSIYVRVCVCARWLSFVFFNTKNEFYLHTPLGRSFHLHCGLMEEWAKITQNAVIDFVCVYSRNEPRLQCWLRVPIKQSVHPYAMFGFMPLHHVRDGYRF